MGRFRPPSKGRPASGRALAGGDGALAACHGAPGAYSSALLASFTWSAST